MKSMTETDFDRTITIRTGPTSQGAIDSVVFKLRRVSGLGWGRRRHATKEAVINAGWLYLDSLPDEELAQVFREFLPRLESLMGGRESGDSQGGTSHGGDEDGPGPARPVGHAELPPPKPPRRSPRKPKR